MKIEKINFPPNILNISSIEVNNESNFLENREMENLFQENNNRRAGTFRIMMEKFDNYLRNLKYLLQQDVYL